MKLNALVDYDAANGRLQLIGSVSMEWRDDSENVSVNTGPDKTTYADLTTTTSLLVSPQQIWTPQLLLVNDVATVSSIGDASFKVRYNLRYGL